MSVAPLSSQSQLPVDMELAHTPQRLHHAHSLHTHSQSSPPAAHTHRLPAKLGAPVHAPIQPDMAHLLPCFLYRCESTYSSSSSSMGSWSKNRSPRQKRVVFADSVGLPLTEVRVFVSDPHGEGPPRYPEALKRGQRSLGVCAGRHHSHRSTPALPHPCIDFPAFQARPQDRMPLQAHNDTLRRGNINPQRASTHTFPKAHTLSKAQIQPLTHTLPKAHTQAKIHTHATAQTQTTEHTQAATHTLPKALTHATAQTQTVSLHPPGCGHSVMVSRQQPVFWPRSRSPVPQPDYPPRVHSWTWQEGMAVY